MWAANKGNTGVIWCNWIINAHCWCESSLLVKEEVLAVEWAWNERYSQLEYFRTGQKTFGSKN